MTTSTTNALRKVFSVHWKPNRDLAVVGLSWLLVTGTLYTATVIVGSGAWGGMAYFVRDGHHRISVSRAFGQTHIDAEVTTWQAVPPYPWQPEIMEGSVVVQRLDPSI